MIIDGRRAEPPSQAGTVDIALYRAADIDALPVTRTEINCKRLRAVAKGRCSPLAALQPAPA
ncbi:hypothetical protein ACFWM0_26225 [Streptomyces sp. NPDC058405]|uniref:hypothetical protein n=1 Tax=Streptomyces sp. NPDC058405 TaxID=3346482 RepID=UPI00365FF1FD